MDDSLRQFREDTLKAYNRNQDDFEKQLIYISSGSLGLSMFFIEKVVKDIMTTEMKGVLCLGWIFLTATLLINIYSHYLANKFNYKTVQEIDSDSYNYNIAIRRNTSLQKINYSSLIFLVLGILSIVFFSSYNILHKNKSCSQMQNSNSLNKVNVQSEQNDETTKGVVTSPPIKIVTVKK